jgi:hypothetical protein
MAHPSRFPFCPHCKEQVIPDTENCPACGKAIGAKVLARWKAQEPPHFGSARRALVSMGLGPWGRRVGKAIVGTLFAFVLYAWLVYATSAGPANGLDAFAVTGLALFCAYDIWAFTHGRTTVVGQDRHKANLSNVGRRTFGLGLDVVLMAFCASLFVRGI